MTDNIVKDHFVYWKVIMGLSVGGAGLYGSIGATASLAKTSRGAAGNSKLMKASSMPALNSLAKTQAQKFISNGKQMSRGASGNSRISVIA